MSHVQSITFGVSDHHLENVILFIRTQVAFEMNFCISV